MSRKLFAEAIGTFALVAAVLGAAVISGNAAGLGASFSIGLAVMAMAYAVGSISGGHFNPAVTLGMFAAGRFNAKDILPYWAAQLAGGLAGALFIAIVIRTKADGIIPPGFGSNGYGEHSPGGFSMMGALIAEVVLTALFIFVIARATRKDGAGNLAPVAIGLTLTMIHLISIPITNTSVNPARSIGPAIFEGGWALQQVWLFVIAPLVGGYIGGLLDKALGEN